MGRRLFSDARFLKSITEDRELKPNALTKTMYFTDPEQVAHVVSSIIVMHDRLKKRSVLLQDSWFDLGLSELDKIEVIDQIEKTY